MWWHSTLYMNTRPFTTPIPEDVRLWVGGFVVFLELLSIGEKPNLKFAPQNLNPYESCYKMNNRVSLCNVNLFNTALLIDVHTLFWKEMVWVQNGNPVCITLAWHRYCLLDLGCFSMAGKMWRSAVCTRQICKSLNQMHTVLYCTWLHQLLLGFSQRLQQYQWPHLLYR